MPVQQLLSLKSSSGITNNWSRELTRLQQQNSELTTKLNAEGAPRNAIQHEAQVKLTGTPTARGLFVTFLPSRPLKWGFRMFFRSNFPTFRPWALEQTILSTPLSISGWPHHLNPSF
jgi:hypothetical protein